MRRFFALPGALAGTESLSPESCTEIFRLIRYNATPNRMRRRRMG